MTILHRIYYNGLYVVAELQEGDEKGLIPFRENRTFPLNAENLEERIKNREDLGLDTSEDRKALSLIRSHKDYKP